VTKIDRLNIRITKLDRGRVDQVDDLIAREEPLEMRIRYTDSRGVELRRRVAVVMRTPGEDEALIRGFFYTEGLIGDRTVIQKIILLEENLYEVLIDPDVRLDENLLDRNFYTSSSCGVCGKASIESVQVDSQFLPWTSTLKVRTQAIRDAYIHFNRMDGLFSQTGGNHMVALTDQDGNICQSAEDVGRHNALDKLIGKSNLPLFEHMLVVSGRASFELVQKAAKAGIPIFLAIGAPSSLALQLAEEHGMTLIGFLKEGSMNIYTGEKRIADLKEEHF
jgi:FdhD protein